ALQLHELRWLSRRRCDGLGGTEPGRRSLALRRRGRGNLRVHLLRAPAWHAGIWRHRKHGSGVEAGDVRAVAAAAGERAYGVVEVRAARVERSFADGVETLILFRPRCRA